MWRLGAAVLGLAVLGYPTSTGCRIELNGSETRSKLLIKTVILLELI